MVTISSKKLPRNLRMLELVISTLKTHGHPISKLVVEEYEYLPNLFDVKGSAEPLTNVNWKPLEISKEQKGIAFQAFIDGVQRTAQIYWIKLEDLGAQIPILVAHIGVGVITRDEQGKLHIDPSMIVDRLLLCMPLKGMEYHRLNIHSKIEELFKKGIIVPDTEVAKDPLNAFSIGDRYGKIILCDTTFTGIEEDSRKKQWEDFINNGESKGLLIEDELYNLSKIKSRAYGRVNTLRQILEMIMLFQFRKEYGNNPYILVDGPLIFVAKWFRAYSKAYSIFNGLSDPEKERFILKNAVGVVKSLRARPGNINNLKKILNLKDGERSQIFKIRDVVDVSGEEGQVMSFIEPHITTFLRLRVPYGNLSLPSPIGLIRVDLHISTLGFDTMDELKAVLTSNPQKVNGMVDKIVNGVLRERWPLVQDKGRRFTEVYPIKETENVLKARLYSTRELAYISTLIRG